MNTLRIAATTMLSLAALIGTAIVVAAAVRDPCTRLPLDMTAPENEAECAVAARDWRPDTRLTSDPHRSLPTLNFGHAIAVDALGGVHVVWSDDRDGIFRVLYKQSDDGGATWGADTLLSSASEPVEHPTIAVSGLTVHVAWHEVRDGLPRVRYRRSPDRGRSFGDDTPLTLVSSDSAHASIAVDGRNVHAVWVGSRGGHGEVYTRHSSDDGASWGPETRLSDLPYDSYVPTIAVSGDHVYAAWVDTSDGNEEEYLRASHDGGTTWGPITRVTRNPANSWAPSLAAEGETVHLVWFDQQDSPVQPRETEGMLGDVMAVVGLSYVPTPDGIIIPDPNAAARQRATEKMQQIAAAADDWARRGGNAARLRAILDEVEALGRACASYLVKERKLDAAMRLMGLTYVPGPPVALPVIFYGDALAVHVRDMLQQIIEAGPQWVRRGGDPRWLESTLKSFEQAMRRATFEWEIYYAQSEDGGRSWSAVTRLTHARGTSLRPSLAATGDDLHVVWFDGRSGDTEIYYKRSRDAGRTWGPDVRLTHSRAEASLPSIAVDDGVVHVVWSDTRDGNPEIYYKRSAGAARGP
jgi:hypothetical protein